MVDKTDAYVTNQPRSPDTLKRQAAAILDALVTHGDLPPKDRGKWKAVLRQVLAISVPPPRPRHSVDDRTVAALRSKGATQREIADRLGVGVASVNRAIQRLRGRR